MRIDLANRVVELAADEEPGEEFSDLEGEEVEEGEPANPILPTTNELFWGALTFFTLWALMKWVLLPPILKAMDARAEKIREDRDAAERASLEAKRLQQEYDQAISTANAEGTRIVEDARHAAEERRRELVAAAEADIAGRRAEVNTEVVAAKEQALAELRGGVTDLALDAAEAVMQRDVDRSTQAPVVDQFVSNAGNGS